LIYISVYFHIFFPTETRDVQTLIIRIHRWTDESTTLKHHTNYHTFPVPFDVLGCCIILCVPRSDPIRTDPELYV